MSLLVPCGRPGRRGEDDRNQASSSRAPDQDGNRYRFLYSNQFRVSNTTADPDAYTGIMVDLFLLRGDGPAKLRNGFLARITTDLENFAFDPIFAFGDPIDFETGAAICDPL